jgi:replicative DNA helicase
MRYLTLIKLSLLIFNLSFLMYENYSMDRDYSVEKLKVPPNSMQAEQAVLGSLMIDNQTWDSVADQLVESDFYRRNHQLIFRIIEQLAEEQMPFDIVTLSDALRSMGELDNAGGLPYLIMLVEDTPTAANILAYAKIVKDRSVLRQLIHVGTEISNSAFNPEGRETADLLENAERQVFKIAEQRQKGQGGFVGIKTLLAQAVEKIERMYAQEGAITGASTGFTDFDELTSGLQPSDLIIVAGRPSMGKCFGKGTPILMYSGEVKAVEDIQVGDELMGDDSTPRRVLSLARGREAMYWVRQNKAMDYRVNESHILSFKHSETDITFNLPLLDYLDYLEHFPESTSRLLGYKATQPIEKTAISIEYDKIDDYYGFVCDGNRLFLLEDMTVVHNTTIAMNMAENVALHSGGKPVLIFSMEMPGDALTMRMMSSLGRIDQHKVRTGKLDDDDWPRLTSAINLLVNTKLFIDDTPALSSTEVRARARRVAREHGQLGLIVVDYLQLMQSPSSGDNRVQQISDISRGLKALAKEMKVPVVALSQLNRNLEQRPNKRPQMSDLRDSGAIEQDADLIVFVYRDEVYNPETAEKGVAEMIIGKQRNGPLGTVRLTFLGQYTRFENFAGPSYSSEDYEDTRRIENKSQSNTNAFQIENNVGALHNNEEHE